VHALPPVDTPVVDTDSFWDKWNVKRMIRQSAAAALVNASDAISASHPVFNIMSPPTRAMPGCRRSGPRRIPQVTQPAVAFKPLTP